MECIFIHTYAAIEPTPPRDTAAQGASSVAAASRPGNRSRLTRRVTTVSYEATYSESTVTLYPLCGCGLPRRQCSAWLAGPGERPVRFALLREAQH